MFVYDFARPTEEQEIHEFLQLYYLLREPLNQAAQIRLEDFQPVIRGVTERCLDNQLSVTCRHKETNELVGIMLCSIWDRSEESESYYNTSTRNDQLAAVHDEIVNIVHNSFWKLVDPTVKRVIHQEMSSVSDEYQRKGIATGMLNFFMDRRLDEIHDADGIVSEVSSLANQKFLKKKNFETLFVLRYDNWRDSNGEVFIQPSDGSQQMELMWKPLR
ncbi:unnamed protein product [Auanema sp. JU1783]|nr:unnamed protein product [Auanema sp. JU1783]